MGCGFAPPGKRREQIEASPASLEIATAEIERERIDQDLVMKALADFSKIFAEIQPHKQKELLRLVLHKAILSPDYVKMALFGRPPDIGPLATAEPRSVTCNWLLGQVSQGVVVWDRVAVVMKRIARGQIRLSSRQRSPRGATTADAPYQCCLQT